MEKNKKDMRPRQYLTKADPEFDEIIIELAPDQTAAELREELYYHWDDSCYWAKETELGIFYSRDELFSSEREQATHLVIFMK